jgi:hypothetical protein
MLLPQTARLTTEPPAPGLYPDVPAETYFAWRAASASLLKVVQSETLAHAKAVIDGRLSRNSEAKRFGTQDHAFLLEPKRFASEFLVHPGSYTDDDGAVKKIVRNKTHARYKELLAKVAGDEDRIVWEADLRRLQGMRERLYRDAHRRKLCTGRGLVEASVVWVDQTTGLTCKARFDKLYLDVRPESGPANIFIDAKTTCSADPSSFMKDIANYGYDLGAAMYAQAVRSINDLPTECYLLAQETEEPFEPLMVRMDDERCQPTGLACGEFKRSEAMAMLANALATGEWPGYGDGIFACQLPAWAVPQQLLQGV